ncbi:MAG TPA: GNAT family N-acetyltransferase [Candidatus Limnocylindria bacterium]|nr:GNAT family N-acetyltransferase [Candidatus Limnocylindria bacterium]
MTDAGQTAEHPPVEVASPAVRRELERHEGRVAGATGRRFVDLGDAILVHDRRASEPWRTWLGDVRWPAAGRAFDRRLIDALALFATIDRRPSIWVQPGTSGPSNLAERLRAGGFAAGETAYRMGLRSSAARSIAAAARDRPGLAASVVSGPASGDPAVADAAQVMASAFGVTRTLLAAELEGGLAVPGATMVVVRAAGGEAVGAGRSFVLDGAAYLSAIGVRPGWRSRGIGRFVTAVLAEAGFRAGSRTVHLGVAASNVPAWRAYAALGFRALGPPATRFELR